MLKYESLSEQLISRMEEDRRSGTSPRVGCDHSQVIRRRESSGDHGSVWRPAFVHDIDKILHDFGFTGEAIS